MTAERDDAGDAFEAPMQEGAIDWSVLEALGALRKPGAPDPRRKLISIYLDSAAGLMEGIRAAISNADGPALAKAAHSMKSSSLNVGAKGLGALFAELEQIGSAENPLQAGDLLPLAERQYEAVTAVFTETLLRGE